MNSPTLPSPHRHVADLTAYAWTNRLVGFAAGLIVSSLCWLVLLEMFRR